MPTYIPHLVHATLDLLIDDEKGIWHLANQGCITWADLAYEVARRAGLNNTYIDAFPALNLNYNAPRPHNSVLRSAKINLLPTLEHGLHCFFEAKQLVTT